MCAYNLAHLPCRRLCRRRFTHRRDRNAISKHNLRKINGTHKTAAGSKRSFVEGLSPHQIVGKILMFTLRHVSGADGLASSQSSPSLDDIRMRETSEFCNRCGRLCTITPYTPKTHACACIINSSDLNSIRSSSELIIITEVMPTTARVRCAMQSWDTRCSAPSSSSSVHVVTT